MFVRELHRGDANDCDDVVRSLPHFFGSKTGVGACGQAVRTQHGWVADEAGQVHAFIVVDYPLPAAPEITWMAVRAGYRRQGIGRTLVDRVPGWYR